MSQTIGGRLLEGWVADLENPRAVVYVGRVKIVMPDPCLLKICQGVDQGLDKDDHLTSREMHCTIVTALHNFC